MIYTNRKQFNWMNTGRQQLSLSRDIDRQSHNMLRDGVPIHRYAFIANA